MTRPAVNSAIQVVSLEKPDEKYARRKNRSRWQGIGLMFIICDLFKVFLIKFEVLWLE